MKSRILVTLSVLMSLVLGYTGTIQHFTPQPYGDADWIYFANGIKFNITEGESYLPSNLKTEKSDYYLVHCMGPIYSEYKSKLIAAGATVYSYISNYTFVVRMDEATKNDVTRFDFVNWIGFYQPAYKISGQPEFENLQGRREITVILYPDAEFNGVIEFLQKIGAQIIDTGENRLNRMITCIVDLIYITDIANLETVRWIEPKLPIQLHNNTVQWILQTCSSENRRIWDKGIRGEGELVSTCDSGIRTSHYAFRSTETTWITTWGDYPTDRKIIAYKEANNFGVSDFGDEASNYYHGTHTGGTITGDDYLNGTDLRDGLAIKARIYFLDAGRATTGGIWVYADLHDLYDLPYNGNAAGSVKIMSNSWGSAASGAYTSSAQESDDFMWDNPDFLLFFSNGNIEGPSTEYVGSPATAKNMVSVGSCGSGSSWAFFSTFTSHGPCLDGRLKPTLLAPGSGVASASGAGDTGYGYMSGTSMSSPGAAGAGALVRQYFREGWWPTGGKNNPEDSLKPSAALIKAMLVNSCDPSLFGHTVPDTQVGWGRIDLDSVLYFARDEKGTEIVDHTSGLTTGNYVEYDYTVTSSGVPFRATLVWTDYPGALGGGIALVNDLNLTVTDPNVDQYKGNVYSGGVSVTGGSYDSLNVEECVRINSPATGTWTVRIDAANCPEGPQPFALVVTAALEGFGIVEDATSDVKTEYMTYAPYPNPFNRNTCLSFALPASAHVKISVYSVAGQLIRTVLDNKCDAGLNKVYWDGKDTSGIPLPDGVYFYSVQTDEHCTTGKVIIQH